MTKEVTATTIVAGALSVNDFNPLHHDGEFARERGMPDIYMGLQVTSGWAYKYLTSWAGPGSLLRRAEFRLGVPCFPGTPLIWTGKVVKKYRKDGEHLVDVEYTATVPAGTHCAGMGAVVMPVRGTTA